MLFVDDASEYNREVKKRISKLLDGHVVIWRKDRYYSVRNAYELIHTYCDDSEGIVLNLDADDWLADRNAVKTLVNHYRQHKCLFSYGDCFLWDDHNQNLIQWRTEVFKKLDFSHLPIASKSMEKCNIPYPRTVARELSFRDSPFYVLHPRSWKVKAFKKIPKEAFMRSDGNWLQFCEDQAIFFPLFEMFPCDYAVCTSPLSVYNQANLAADIKLYRLETLRDEIEIRRKPKYEPIHL